MYNVPGAIGVGEPQKKPVYKTDQIQKNDRLSLFCPEKAPHDTYHTQSPLKNQKGNQYNRNRSVRQKIVVYFAEVKLRVVNNEPRWGTYALGPDFVNYRPR